ncbi:branched-chain amino acid ABC transporter permease [soil metagenome]
MGELPQAVVSGVLIGCVYALLAVGLALIWGVMDVVNFAHGNFLMVAMYATFFAWSFLGLDPLLGTVIAVLVLVALSLATFFVAIRPVLRGTLLSQMVVTFGLLLLLQGAAQLLFTPSARAVAHPWLEGVRVVVGGVVLGGPQLGAAAAAIMGLVALWWLLNRTEVGLAIRAVAQDRKAAEVMGIQPDRIFAITWAISGACVGLAGAMLMNFYAVDPAVGFQFGLIAFVVVALGGFGSLRGALLAGVAMGATQVVVGLYVPAYGLAAIFVLYLLVFLIRPRGLLGAY